MICPCCEDVVEMGSRIYSAVPTPDGARLDRYVCRNCQAEFTVTVALTKPSPLEPADLESRRNLPGSRARG